MNKSGYIRLHRALLQWEWYTDANTFRVFMHILLSANWQEGRFKGQEIKRGQMITTIARIARELKLTNKQVRVALEHLSETGEIMANGVANRWTLITIVNYGFYQSPELEQGKPKGKPRANQGQTEGKPRAMIEEEKEEKEINNVYCLLSDDEVDELMSHVSQEDELELSDELLKASAEGIKNPYKYAVGVAKNLGMWRDK